MVSGSPIPRRYGWCMLCLFTHDGSNFNKEYYAPKIESFYNLYKIAELQGKLLKKYDLNRPLFMYTNLLHGEEEIADLIRKYNLHEL